jgi:hypothetical protein
VGKEDGFEDEKCLGNVDLDEYPWVFLLLLLGVDLAEHLHSGLLTGDALAQVVLHRPLDKAVLYCHREKVAILILVSLGHDSPHEIRRVGLPTIHCTVPW